MDFRLWKLKRDLQHNLAFSFSPCTCYPIPYGNHRRPSFGFLWCDRGIYNLTKPLSQTPTNLPTNSTIPGRMMMIRRSTSMFAARSFIPAMSRRTGVTVQRLPFHSSASASVQVGDGIPDMDVLAENSPGNKVNLAEELKGKGKGLIIGVPAAFSELPPSTSTSTNAAFLLPPSSPCQSMHISQLSLVLCT